MDDLMGATPGIPGQALKHGQGRLRRPMSYPSPYFDISKFYMPPTVKELFKWCRYYYKTSELIYPVIFKMAEYPVTDLVFEPADSDVEEKEADRLEKILREHFNIKGLLIKVGLDYFTYGNSFITIYFPFKRYLVCKACNKKNQFEDFSDYGPRGDLKFRQFEFSGTCPACKSQTKFDVEDIPVKQLKRINFVRLNPENIDIEHSGITGISHYYYSIPNSERRKVLGGDFDTVKTLPWLFIQAVKEKKKVKLNPSNLFHFKRADISDGDDGWGMPLVLPAMRGVFYLNVLRKAQEAIAFEHLVPLRVLFPSDNQSQAAPHLHTGLGQWKNRVEQEIKKWKFDPNYIPIMPVPLGFQQIGGDGKMLLLTQEIRQVQESIVNAMTVPQEFVFGGLSWSGSSISLRMLENHFLVYREDLIGFLDFISHKISSFLDVNPVKIRMQEFKMADDIQRKQLFLQLNQMQKISDDTLLKEVAGIDFRGEVAQIVRDLMERYEADRLIARQQGLLQAKTQGLIIEEQAEAQRKALEIQQRGDEESPPADSAGSWYDLALMLDQAEAQEAAEQQAISENEMQLNPRAAAAHYAQQIMEYPPEARQQILDRIKVEMPELAGLVESQLQALIPQEDTAPAQQAAQSAPAAEKAESLPEQLPPRREAGKAVI